MKLPSFKTHRKAFIGAALFTIATPAFGLFGFSIVYDPTEVAQTIANVKQAIQTALNTKQALTTMEANLKNFNVKTLWQTAQATLMAENAHNTYGETAGWNPAMNTNSPGTAKSAWSMANLQVSPGTYLSGQTPGNSPGLSSLAMVEAFDSSSPNCMNAVGQYRSLQTSNAPAENALQSTQFDTTTATNTEIEQLNLLNASDAQQMHELQSQGALHACLAEQMTISNMAQRNAAAVAINDAAFIEQQRGTNNVNPANESTTWQTYLP